MCATKFIKFPKSSEPAARFNIEMISKWQPYNRDGYYIRIITAHESYSISFEIKRDWEYACEMLDKETTKIG